MTKVMTDLVQTDISVLRIGMVFHPITEPEIYDSTKLLTLRTNYGLCSKFPAPRMQYT